MTTLIKGDNKKVTININGLTINDKLVDLINNELKSIDNNLRVYRNHFNDLLIKYYVFCPVMFKDYNGVINFDLMSKKYINQYGILFA